MKSRKSNTVPFISPRGVYGVNIFLFLYFNKISYVGISLDPWNLYRRNSIAVIGIEEIGTFYEKPGYIEYKKIYYYIINNQDQIGPPGKVKGFILFLFYIIHEIGDYSEPGHHVENLKNIIYAIIGGLSDVLPFVIDNTYYNYEHLNYSEEYFQQYVIEVSEELSLEEFDFTEYDYFSDTEQFHPYKNTIDYVATFFYGITDDFVPLYDFVNKSHN